MWRLSKSSARLKPFYPIALFECLSALRLVNMALIKTKAEYQTMQLLIDEQRQNWLTQKVGRATNPVN